MDDIFNKTFENCGQIQEEIDKLEDSIPEKDLEYYKEWKKKMNFLLESYNKMITFVVYKQIN